MKNPAFLSTGYAPNLRDDHFDNETAAGFDVSGGTGKHCKLFVLCRYIHGGVGQEVHQLERAWNPGTGHVTDRHRDCVGARPVSQLFGHVWRQLDSAHRQTSLAQRQRYPSGSHGYLEGWSTVGQLGQKVEDRVEDGRSEPPGVDQVVDLGDLRIPRD